MGGHAVGVLVKTWPKLSETFILEEILGLERLGQSLAIFALNAPSDRISHDAVAQVRAPVTCLAGGAASADHPLAAARAHLQALVAAPLAYARALAATAARREPGRRRDFHRGVLLAQALRTQRVSHLHVHFISEPAAVAEIASRLSGIGYSLSAHAKDIWLSRPEVLQRKLARARFTVTCTECNREHLAGLGERVHRMYHGIDLDQFHPRLRNPDHVSGQPPLILAVGRLREKKGFDTLIDACAQLRDAGVDFRVEIVGYGEEEQKMRWRIDALRLADRIALTGKLARAQVIERYARAAAFVMPAQIAADGDRDGIPNVLLEAMAMQVPVVATRVSGIPELVRDGINGLLIEPKQPAVLARALQQVLADPRLGERLGVAGRRAVTESFDNSRNLQLLRGLLEQTHATV